MGRLPKRDSVVIANKKYNWVPKQIVLRGITLEMFNYDRADREITESALGYEIIKNHYRMHPPLGFKPKD